MKTFLTPAFALFVALAAPIFAAPADVQAQTSPSAATPEQTNTVVSQVQAFYDSSKTFKSDFVQKFWVKAYSKEKESSGSVIFSKPGKMHWRYADPAGNHVVSDGTLLKVYEAGNQQMFEQTVDKSQYPAALSFLTGQGKLADAFDFQLFEGEQMAFKNGWVLVGVPKASSLAYSKVLFYIDKATKQVRRVMIIDGQGNRNRFDFLNPRLNEPVDASEFNYTPPPGTSIIKQ